MSANISARLSCRFHTCKFLFFWLAVSTLYALTFGICEFADSPVESPHGFLIVSAQWFAIGIAASALTGLLALNRIIFAAGFPILTLLSTIASYFRITLHQGITANVLELAFINDKETWFTLVSTSLIILCLFSLLVSVAIAVYRYKYVEKSSKWWLYLMAFVLVTAVYGNNGRLRSAMSVRLPYSYYYAYSEYLDNRKSIDKQRSIFDKTHVSVPEESPVVIVVIGESLRADHLHLNGYNRDTTPELDKDTAVMSMRNMYSSPYYTHTSVPHILTRADSIHPDRAYDEQSFITLFKKGGYHTSWIGNQGAVPSYAYFMHEADTLIQCNAGRDVYSYDKWLDSDLLKPISEMLERKEPRQLAVVHCIGSHWWYKSHYTESDARFKPEADSKIISELSQTSMINSYDNTIVATDRFLAAVINLLRDRNAVLIYISDHGEALGENGKYLHAEDYPQLHHPACLIWYSPEYAAKYPKKIKALKENRNRRNTTDYIFHSVLDAAGMQTSVLNPDMSVFR